MENLTDKWIETFNKKSDEMERRNKERHNELMNSYNKMIRILESYKAV